jgi:hypothetical protein
MRQSCEIGLLVMAGLGQRAVTKSVMAGLGPAIHVLLVAHPKDVDARDKPGHDSVNDARVTQTCNFV